MSLSVEHRMCGEVYIIRCNGRIVNGSELPVLQSAIDRGVLETKQLVLDVAEVDRVDSTGMGVMVRYLHHLQGRGGDLRLATPKPFFQNLLQLTKLSGIFRVYETEQQAIVSFLNERASVATGSSRGPKVLFLDQSPDLCTFVRTVLNNYGYAVVSTCRLYDARLLLCADEVAYLVLGPQSSELSSADVVEELRPLAKHAKVIQLQKGFHIDDPDNAAASLLQHMQANA